MTKHNTKIDPDTGETLYQVALAKWITQREKDIIDARNKASSALSEYFELRGETYMSPCACLGIQCHKFACPALWNMFLTYHDGELLEFIKGIK